MSDDTENDILRVLAFYGEALERNLEKASATAALADVTIDEAQRLLKTLGKGSPERNGPEPATLSRKLPRLRTWEEIVAEARVEQPHEISFANILDADEIAAATDQLSRWKLEFAGLNELTGYDYAVAGAAGIFAGLADILLVQLPKIHIFWAVQELRAVGSPTSSRKCLASFCRKMRSAIWNKIFVSPTTPRQTSI